MEIDQYNLRRVKWQTLVDVCLDCADFLKQKVDCCGSDCPVQKLKKAATIYRKAAGRSAGNGEHA